jgi:hypothetical protein
MTVRELERAVKALTQRLAELEKTVAELTEEEGAKLAQSERELATFSQESPSSEQLIDWMRAEGLIIDPPVEFSSFSKRWRNLPETEKQEILWELDHLSSGPMASDILLENRR